MLSGPVLTLLHTNDVHSQMEGWLRLAGRIKAERAAAGPAVLYLDAGDHQDKSVPEVEATAGRVNLDLLRAAGCDAAAWGNGEVVGLTPEQLSAMLAEAPFPVLMANLRRLSTGAPIPGARASLVREAGGVRVGLIGLMVPFRDILHAMDLVCLPEAEVVAPLVQELRAAGCDVVVCISHLGLFADRRLAQAVPGIDVICGAHTHHALDRPELINGTLVVQAGVRASHLGRLRLYLKPEGGVDRFEYDLLPISPELPPDPEAAAVLAHHRQVAKARMGEVIAVLRSPVPHELEGPYPLVQSLSEELRRRLDAEVGLVHTGLFLRSLPAGPVTRADLAAACPSVLYGVSLDLPGCELQRTLEQARDPARIYHEIWAGARGKYVGSLAVAGLTGPIEPDRMYKVATTGFMIFKFTGYDRLPRGQNVRWHMDWTVRQIAADLLADGKLER